MEDLIPFSPISTKSAYWAKAFSFLPLILITIVVFFIDFTFYNWQLEYLSNQEAGSPLRSPLFPMASVVIGLACFMLAMLTSYELNEIGKLRKRGLEFLPLKSITDDEKEIMGLWEDSFPHIKAFVERCISQNGLVTKEDYLLARNDILKRLRIPQRRDR